MTTLICEEQDLYLSRVEASPTKIPRQEPVIWGTEDDGPLGQSQLEFFDKHGFLFFENMFSQDEIKNFSAEVGRMKNDNEWFDSDKVIREPASQDIRSFFYVHRNNEVFKALSRNPRICGIAEQILGSRVYIHQSRVNLR